MIIRRSDLHAIEQSGWEEDFISCKHLPESSLASLPGIGPWIIRIGNCTVYCNPELKTKDLIFSVCPYPKGMILTLTQE